jgi:hypothetical protein
LYFSKKASEKASPAGIFNLVCTLLPGTSILTRAFADISSLQSEVSDIVEEGTIDFSFSSHGHKHTFQASTSAERDNWVAVLKTKIEAAKELATTVPETEGYKTALSELTKPTFVAPIAVPKKSVDKVEPAKEDKKEEKKEEKAEAKVEKKEEKKEEKTARKSRSASRKRNSIFGTFSLGGKKEEKTEVAKEETPVAPAPEAPATEEAAAPASEPVVAAEAPAAEAASPTEARPAATKRNSIFESLKVRATLLSFPNTIHVLFK